MADLVNEFSWSLSRDKLFRECPRAYFFHYYGSWGGWDRRSGERPRLLYVLKRMSALDLWAGDLVHRVIEEACQRARRAGPGDGADPEAQLGHARDRAVALLRREWVDSQERRWEDAPKHYLNLFEHYYGTPLPRERTDAIKERVLGCLGQFFRSSAWEEMRRTPAAGWLTIEALDSFPVEGVRVYARPDLAQRRGGRVVLYDWKTGRPRPDDEDQLVAYSLYALHKGWAAALEEVEAVAAYLATGEWRRVELDGPRAEAVRARVREGARSMRALLDDPEANRGTEGRFPLTEDLAACRRCNFRAACEGARRPGAELSGASPH
ncbi:MAG: PD-(D/E)XK nuclease family protein [Planctomycetes bacterium]|nr:PD-(D/E)XK nuclease family protein [Planctomycetota bacterium]